MSTSIPSLMKESTATGSQWLEGARPHTWPNAFAPVIAGTGAAWATGRPVWWAALLAAVVALALIVGVNYANDYSDGIRGTDDDRTGPLRLTGSGLVPPALVKYAAFASFGVAGLAGIILSVSTGHWWLVLVGIVCVLGAWFYTGGSHPYGYMGLGEVAVFVFFGLVAVLGTQFTQAGHVDAVGVACAVGIGAASSAVNLANNLRDIYTDKESGKITLAVRLGDKGTRRVWVVLAAMPVLMSIGMSATVSLWTLLGLVAAPLLVKAARPVVSGASGKELIPVLGATGKAMMVWSVVTTLALAIA